MRAHPPEPTPAAPSAAPEPGGLLEEFSKLQMEGVSKPPPPASRKATRRQQQAEAAQQPYVARAMELFDVPPDKLKYSPPKDDGG